MHALLKLHLALALAAAATLAGAQENDRQAAQAAPASQDAAATRELTDGEVRKIDKEAGKITLRHGEIKNLGMAPMTMVLRVREAAMLEQVKVGDQVRFAADRIDGAITVVQLEKTQ